MLDLPHILYILISGVITALGLWAAAKFAKSQRHKDIILKASAIGTVVIHYSDLWVDFFSNGGVAQIENNHILLIYPCHIIMWFLLVAALSNKKESVPIKVISEFAFWGGIVCGSIGIIFNINYDNNPNLLDYDILKGLLSHSFMLFGCIYLLVGKYIKIRVSNVLSCVAGLSFFIIDGAIINLLFEAFDIPSVNAMFLEEPPFPEHPWMSVHLLVIIVLPLLFGALALYEKKCFPEEERWNIKLKKFIDEKRGDTK